MIRLYHHVMPSVGIEQDGKARKKEKGKKIRTQEPKNTRIERFCLGRTISFRISIKIKDVEILRLG